MTEISPSLKFFLNLAKVQTVLARRFDLGLGGLGFSDFVILFHLSQVRDERLRRVDLAEKVGLTASGVTRLLAPMEKVGLIKRETTEHDARVSYVRLAPGGKGKLAEALEDAELLAEELISKEKAKNIVDLSQILVDLGGVIK